MLHTKHYHKDILLNSRLNQSFSYTNLALVVILHFQSGRVVRALVEPSNITRGQCSMLLAEEESEAHVGPGNGLDNTFASPQPELKDLL